MRVALKIFYMIYIIFLSEDIYELYTYVVHICTDVPGLSWALLIKLLKMTAGEWT